MDILEGFAVETADGLIFTVKGHLHPPERVIAYLRYLPDPAGDRRRQGRSYRRIYDFAEQRQILTARYPGLIGYDPVLGGEVQSVPRTRISVVHDPTRYLETLRRHGATRPVEEDALALALAVQEAAGVPWAALGISGSLMLGTQRPDSDIDLLVYGEAAGRAVYRALAELMARPGGEVRTLSEAELHALHQEHQSHTPLSFEDFRRAQTRKANEGRFRGRSFFVRFVQRPEEFGEHYGDHIYRPLGPATVEATICDDRDALFTPCRYNLQGTTFLDGAAVPVLAEIISHRGRFADQVRTGERVQARGKVEEVVSRDGYSFHQLVVGATAGDYMRVLSE